MRFDASHDAVVFSASMLDDPNPASDPALVQALEHHDIVAIVAIASVMAEAAVHDIEPDEEYFRPYRELLRFLKLEAREVAEAYAETRDSEAVEADL